MRVVLLFLIFIFSFSCCNAVEFKGSFVQGSFILAKTNPSAKVLIDKTAVKVSKEGFFVFGIGRNRKNNIIIKIINNDKV